MDIYTATEQAYKNGYSKGVKDVYKLAKEIINETNKTCSCLFKNYICLEALEVVVKTLGGLDEEDIIE